MSSKHRVIFVDDEPKVLRGLRRSLDCMRNEWDMVFVTDAREALELMAKEDFEVVVSDMRMPGMSGVEFLKEVRKRHPKTVRLALSGQSSKESVIDSVGPIHQYLPKPCDVKTLQEILSRLWALQSLLSAPKLQSLLVQLERLPSLPSLYKTLMQEFESPDGSLKKVGRIVTQDMGMSAKVLQLVNSAFFGAPRHVSSPAQAVAALGMDTVKALAMAVCVFAPFEGLKFEELQIEHLWDHSMAVSLFSKQIASAERVDLKAADNIFIAGLLHDVGKLVLASSLPDDFLVALTDAREKGLRLAEAEQAVIGATHAQIGAYLLGLWGFPNGVMQAVAFHHDLRQCPEAARLPAAVVHVANAVAHETRGEGTSERSACIDHDTLGALGFAERANTWADLCRNALLERANS